MAPRINQINTDYLYEPTQLLERSLYKNYQINI